MLFSIAREVGGMTVAELSRRISSREIHEWMALWSLEAEERRMAEAEARAVSGAENTVRMGGRQ